MMKAWRARAPEPEARRVEAAAKPRGWRSALWGSVLTPVGAAALGADPALLAIGGSLIALAWTGVGCWSLWQGARTGARRAVVGERALLRDITARQRLESELQACQSRLVQTERLAGLGHFVLQVPTMRWSASDALYEVFGMTSRGVKDIDAWSALVHPDDRAQAVATLEAALRSVDHPFDLQYRIYRAHDHGLRWVHGRGRLTLDAQGQPDQLLGTVQDITPHKLVETALMEGEQRLAMALDSAALGWWDWDIPARHVQGNARCAELLGLPPETLGADIVAWSSRLCPEDVPRVRAAVTAHLKGQTPVFVCEHRLRHRAGHWIWVRETGRVLQRDAQGRALRVVGVQEDITEVRRDQEMVRKLSLAVEQSPESIMITSLDGVIEYVNEAFTQVSGYTRAEVLGRNPRFLSDPASSAHEHQAMWATLRCGECWRGHFFNVRRDGTPYVERSIVTPIRQPDGEVSHYVAVKQDITEQRRLSEELERYRNHLEELVVSRTTQLAQAHQRAEAANRAKSTFLANMSHEIRTPMNAIVGLTRLLQRSQPTPKQSERLTRLERAADHLLGVLNDLLDFSKIEAGRMVLDVSDFVLADVLAQVQACVEAQRLAQGLGWSVKVDPRIPLKLRGDASRLRQALLNFASNAVKFTERGHVSIKVELNQRVNDLVVLCFEVSDTGLGIAPEDQARLFEPFEQLDATHARRFDGAGLGLSIARRLVDMMGGAVGMRSVPGEGSTFWFTAQLECCEAAHIPPLLTSPEARSARGPMVVTHVLRLLVVEDDEVNRAVTSEVLRSVGCLVETAVDGVEAVMRAASGAYDLIVMDVHLPEQDGIAVTRALREMAHLQQVPIIALSADVQPEERQACLDAGMNDFLAKPVDPEVLVRTVCRYLQQTSGSGLLPQDDAAGLAMTGLGEGLREASAKPGALVSAEPADSHPAARHAVASEPIVSPLREDDWQQLARMLQQGDMRANEWTSVHQAALRQFGSAQAEGLVRAIDQFDYDEALACLQRLREEDVEAQRLSSGQVFSPIRP